MREHFNAEPKTDKMEGLAISEGHGVCYGDIFPSTAEYREALSKGLRNTASERVLNAASASVGHELWTDTGVPGQLSGAVAVSRVLEQAGELNKINPSVKGLAAELMSAERQAKGTQWDEHSFADRQAGDLILTDHHIGIVGKDGHSIYTNLSKDQTWGISTSSEQRYAADPTTHVLRPHDNKPS